MKTARTFKGSWFLAAIIASIAVCEVIAWKLSETYGWRLNPLTVAFVATGLVAMAASVIYEGTDIG